MFAEKRLLEQTVKTGFKKIVNLVWKFPFRQYISCDNKLILAYFIENKPKYFFSLQTPWIQSVEVDPLNFTYEF